MLTTVSKAFTNIDVCCNKMYYFVDIFVDEKVSYDSSYFRDRHCNDIFFNEPILR